MELLLTIFCVWMFFSIKNTKSRVSLLEDEVSTLNLRLNASEIKPKETKALANNLPHQKQKETIEQPELPAQNIKQDIEQDIKAETSINITEDILVQKPQQTSNIPAYTRPDIIKYSSIEKNPEIETKPYQHLKDEIIFPEWLTNCLSGGRLFVTLGILILFIGVVMLFKYSAQYISIPLEMRFIGVAIGAIGMIYFGHRQIGERREYGIYLQGGGLGILFLTIFVAFKFYALLSPTVAFILLGAVAASTFAMSIRYDSMALSVLAITGGFLSPILASTGNGSHIGLFSYYLLLNLIIFAIAWQKSWRVLNSIGFLFTFMVGLVWGGKYYTPQFYISVQFFLIAYFLLYVGIGILFAARQKPDVKFPIDAASVFGVPLIGFSLQIALTRYFPDGQLISCLVFGAFYSCLSLLLRQNKLEGLKLLSDIFLCLALLFFTLSIPFAFDAQTTAPLWAMEGAAMLWMFNRSQQKFYGYAGIILIAVSDLFLLSISHNQGTGIPFANGFFISSLILSISHFFAAYLLQRSILKNSDDLSYITSLLGMTIWFACGFAEIYDWLGHYNIHAGLLAFYSLSAAAAMVINQYFPIKLFDKLAPLTIYAAIIFTAIQIISTYRGYHPLMGYNYLAYITSIATNYYWLWQNRNNDINLEFHHKAGYILLVLLFGFELGYYLNMIEYTTSLKMSGWLLAALAGTSLLVLPEKYRKWPLAVISEKYQVSTAFPILVWAFILCIISFGNLGYLLDYYIPVVNVIDMTEILTIASFIFFYKKSQENEQLKNFLSIAIAATVFLFINAVMLRSLSQYLGFIYLEHRMFENVAVQTSITILWTLISMAAMLISSKYFYRNGWFAGAALLGLVILKLFTVDLDGVGTISRIVSFIGVGLLTIALGYFSPLPANDDKN